MRRRGCGLGGLLVRVGVEVEVEVMGWEEMRGRDWEMVYSSGYRT